MREYTFAIFRKLLCTTLILSLLWPDVAKCMEDEEENLNHSFISHNLPQNNTSDQKGDLQSIDQKESLSSILLKKDTTSSENPKTIVSQEILLNRQENDTSLSEKKEVTETTPLSQDVTNTDENSPTITVPTKNVTETNTVLIEEEFSEENLSENKTGDNNNSSFQELKNKEKKEEGGFGGKTVNSFEIVEEEKGNNLKVPLPIDEEEEWSSPQTKAFLEYLEDYVFQFWPTWKQVLAVVLGTIIGGGVGFGIFVIFWSEMLFDSIWIGGWVSNALNWFDLPTYECIGVASGLDAMMRASSALMSIFDNSGKASFLIDKKSYKKRLTGIKIISYASSLITSGLSVYFLYSSMGIIKIIISNAANKTIPATWALWGILSLSQILDTVFAYGKPLNDRVESNVKKKIWSKLKNNVQSGSKEEKIEDTRQHYIKNLKELMWILYNKMPNDKIKQLYEEIFQKREDGKLEAFKVIEALLKIHAFYDGDDPIPSQKAKKTQASIFGWILAGLASPARHIVFWYSIYAINGLESVPPFTTVPLYLWPLSILMTIIGGTVQGYFEKKAGKLLYYEATGGKTVIEPQCWWPIRALNKAWNYLIQGPIYSVPYVLAFLQATHLSWDYSPPPVHVSTMYLPLPLFLSMLIPFWFADAVNNANGFNESSGKWISAINRLLSYTPFAKYLTGYKKDKLIEITHGFREKMRDLIPEVVKDLDTYFRKKIPNLFLSRTNEEGSSGEGSKIEERESLLKDKTREKNDGFTLLNDMTSDGENTNEQEIIFTRSMELSRQKRTWFGYCLQGLGKCCKGIGSLFTCCSKRSKRKDPFKDMGFLKIEEEVIN